MASVTASRRRSSQGEAMAVEIEGPRFATSASHMLRRFAGGLITGMRISKKRILYAPARPLRGVPAAALGALLALAQRAGLHRFLTSGPLIRFVSRSLQRRIIVANLIGLTVLLGGVFYLSQYHAWLIDAKRESLRAQGEIIAAAIAANASLETGRIVLDPDRLPEMEGSENPFQDDAFAALKLSIAPERVTPILRKLVPTPDTRARVYAQDGTLISDTANFGFMTRAR